ncbi:hypothetical protein KR059_008118 [Drosophila kikkawai]|nr:hypothetical protein KR059_008118 [Drosophila kikkawai]
MDPQPLPRWISGNVGFAGTHATKGYGLGVAIACGTKTEVGKMMELSYKERAESRVSLHLRQVGFYMLAIVLMWLLMGISFVHHDASFIHLEIYITFIIALTPLYLPFILFWGMRTTRDLMQDSQCYARNLEATSTVGLTTVVITDMTRTITKRWMRVTEIFVDMELLSAESANVNELGPRFIELIQASVLCNDAVINSGNIGVPKEKKSMYGNYLDIAMLRYGLLTLPDVNQLRRDHEMVANKAFTSADRVQVTVHRTYGADGELKLILLMKGHCDTVLRHCSTFTVRDEEIPLDDELQDNILNLAEGLLVGGRQVRAFAFKELRNQLELRRISQVYSGGGREFRDYLAVDTFSLRLLGLIATYTPPRSTIPKAVARCRSAGIKLVLVTSHDQYLARAMASEVGLMSPHMDEIKTGRRLSDYRNFRPTEIVDMLEYADEKDHHQRWYIEQLLLNQRDLVFANTEPEQLHWIVEVCQGLGAVVSVIGGSLHDTPALRCANVGAARLGCAPICENSADLVLLDSSFATLSRAIGISRLFFENLKKALAYCLATNTVWIISLLAFFTLRIPLLFNMIDIIIVSVFVNLVRRLPAMLFLGLNQTFPQIPALALLYEFPEENLMQQKPKVYDDCLLNSRLLFVSHILVGTIEAAAVLMTYIMFMVERGFLLTTLVGLQYQWHDETVNDLTDSYGQEWSSVERKQLDCQVSSLCLMAIVVMQCTNLVLNKTGRANLLEHGFGNLQMKLAAAYLIAVCILLWWMDPTCCLHLKGAKYLEWVSKSRLSSCDFLTSYCFSILTFLWVIFPFVPMMVFLESTRRYFLRMFPDSWLERATMF